MPQSLPIFDEEIEAYFREVPHAALLDIGPGEGKYGNMMRRIQPSARRVGVEIDPSYVEKYKLRELYDDVLVQDAGALINDPDQSFSAVVIGDCVEHLRKSAGLDLIHFLAYRSEIIILKFPVGYVQNSVDGHGSEAHISVWSEADFRGLDYLFIADGIMRLCFVRGYISKRAEWIPRSLMTKLGYGGDEVFVNADDYDVLRAVTRGTEEGDRRVSWFAMGDTGARRLYLAGREVDTVMGGTGKLIFVDNYLFGGTRIAGSSQLPFLEKDGQYWGPPLDGGVAVGELERMRQEGAEYIAFSWNAFWWLDFYADFADYLRTTYRLVLQNERVVVFDLRKP